MENPNSVEDKVEFYDKFNEHPGYKVADTLHEKGYVIGIAIGLRLAASTIPFQKDSIGILKPRGRIRKGLLGLLGIKTKQRALFIGTLENIGIDDKWILEVYGRENIQELTDLAKVLSKQHNSKIQINLVNERTRLESYPSDWDGM